MVRPNRYLVTSRGRQVGSRVPAAFISFGPLIASPILFVVGVLLADLLASPAIGVGCLLVAVLLFFGTAVMLWVTLLTSSRQLTRAIGALHAGDMATAVSLCHRPLLTVFRADIRTRAFYILALAAEANADFGDAEDLFQRASNAIPAMAASKWQRHARCLMFAHRAIALVAERRLDEADMVVRQASAFFPQQASNGFIDALSDDAGFGAVGISAALRDIEQGRDPRAFLTLASVLVLSARGYGREALELIERERFNLNSNLWPRERALVANAERRARAVLMGGPMGGPMRAMAQRAPDAVHPWAERILSS